MAISLVGVRAASASNGSDPVINWTGLYTLLENDVVVIVGGTRHSSGADAGVSTSGYTEALDTTDSSGLMNLSVSWKRMGASPDSSATCQGSGHADYGSSYTALILRGVDTSTALDATTTSAVGIGAPNSPSITTVTDGAWVISGFLGDVNDGITTPPTDYTSGTTSTVSETFPTVAGLAYKAITPAGAENPGAWSSISATTYIAVTIAIRPAAAGTFGDGVLAATGTATASFVGPNEIDGQWTVTATGTAAWVGQALAVTGALSATGTGTATFVGFAANDGALASSATATVSWVGDKAYMTAVLEIIESRGAVSVEVS
jgi:hypothetical protein